MLSSHSTRRDRYGIPVISRASRVSLAESTGSTEAGLGMKPWNETHERLRSFTDNLRVLLQHVEFVETWLLPYLNRSAQMSAEERSFRWMCVSGDRSVDGEIDILRQRQDLANVRCQEIFSVMQTLMCYALGGIGDNHLHIPSSATMFEPTMLIRIWTDTSHTEYSDALGFQCSNWKFCRPATSFEELLSQGRLTEEELRNHCEHKTVPSNWISLCSDVSWILGFARKFGWSSDSSCRVAIISMARLNRLSILYRRSNTLITEAGGHTFSWRHPDGVKYAWHLHYLVYGWIPAQCVVAQFTYEEFVQLCAECNIKEGKNSWP